MSVVNSALVLTVRYFLNSPPNRSGWVYGLYDFEVIDQLMICLPLLLAMVAPQVGTLDGYVFRAADGGPPRRPPTVELIEQGRTKYRKTTETDGNFVFNNVRSGDYTIRARFSDFVVAEEAVTVTSGGKNFAAVMLPKRRAKARTFRTVTADQLATQSDRDLQKKLRQAAGLASKGDLAGAARLYEQAAAESGTQPDVWDTLALLYFQMGRKDEAFSAFGKAMEQDPESLLPYTHLGTIYLDERKYKELLVVAKRALAIDSKWMTAYAFLGEAQAHAGELEAAQRSAEIASELTRGRAPGPYLLLAKVCWTRKDCAGARRHMERYLELKTSARELPEVLKSLELLRACGPVH
jgi:tetratricopeptide (TPR) repeat protein